MDRHKPEYALNVPIYSRHFPETMPEVCLKPYPVLVLISSCFVSRGGKPVKKMPYTRQDNAGTKTVIQARLFQKRQFWHFLQACADPIFYIPFPLILGVPDSRRCCLYSRASAFRGAWRNIGKICRHENCSSGTPVSEKVHSSSGIPRGMPWSLGLNAA